MGTITAATKKSAHVFMGKAFDPRWRDAITVTVLVSEEWGEEEPVETPAAEPAETPEKKPAAGGRRKRRGRRDENQLSLETPSKGIFKDVEATIMDGTDLDIPTFRRRGIVIEK
jgi:hypothetical protein